MLAAKMLTYPMYNEHIKVFLTINNHILHVSCLLFG